MSPITNKNIENKRLKLTLGLFIVVDRLIVDTKKNTIQGQIQCFKSDKIVDAINDVGVPQAASVAPFMIENVDFNENIETTVENYVTANLEKIVSV